MRLLGYTLILSMVLALQGCSSLFFQPDAKSYAEPQQFGLQYQDLYLRSKDGTSIHSWHLQGSKPLKKLVFVAHGNGQNLSAHFRSWIWLVKEGYDVVIMDYRGYGKSGGTVSIQGAIEDIQAVLDHIEKEIHPKSYFVCGQSLGGNLLLNALKGRDLSRIDGVILDSAVIGFRAIATEKLSQSFLTWLFQWIPSLTLPSEYNVSGWIRKIDKPLLFLHASFDNVVSLNNSWELFEKAKLPKSLWLAKRAKHTGTLQFSKAQKAFVRYLESIKDHAVTDYAQIKIFE